MFQNQYILKSFDERVETVVTNVIKMLTERKFLSKSSLKQNIELYIKKIDKNLSIPIVSDFDKKKTIYLKLFLFKITTIKSSPEILDFLNKHADQHMIVIIEQINTKVRTQFEEYERAELFEEKNMMINIVECDLVPQHIPLTEEEKKTLIQKYDISKKKEFPKICINDPMVRYFNMKPGDIVKIVGPTPGGYRTHYRMVRNIKM